MPAGLRIPLFPTTGLVVLAVGVVVLANGQAVGAQSFAGPSSCDMVTCQAPA